jgi:hypothetical protein
VGGAPFRRIGGAAGITYVVLVAIENFDVLDTPSYDSSVGEIVAAYVDSEGELAITTVAGTLALFAYVVAAVALLSVVRDGDRERDEAWSIVGLAGAVAGPAVGAVVVGLQATLVLRADEGLSPEMVRLLHDVRLGMQAVAGLPVSLFLVGMAMAGLRGRSLPRWLAWSALAIGAASLVSSTLGFAGSNAARAVLVVTLGVAAAWLLAASVWLLLRESEQARVDSAWLTTARLLAGTVAVAAGVSGAALVLFPDSTREYFSWGLVPPTLAALIGGFYLASSLVYARAVPAPWSELWIMVVGIVALSLPVLLATLSHLEVFDFGRLQAWAWVVLFAAFPAAATATLVGVGRPERHRGDPADDRFHPLALRALTAGVAIGLAAVSLVLWIDPDGSGDAIVPFTPSPLGGRVLGGWTFLLALLAGWIVVHGRVAGSRLAALAMAAFPLGALVAGLRTADELQADSDRLVYFLGILAWFGVGVALVRNGRRDYMP